MATTRTKLAVGGVAAVVLALTAPLVARWEGVRYAPYRDAVGVLTVCYGHTGVDVQPGRTYSKSECDDLLLQDVAEANGYVRSCIKSSMQSHQEAALTSATYNIGPRVVCGSTLQRYANAGNWSAACAELARWDKAGGRTYRGLTLRRADERAMCDGRVK